MSFARALIRQVLQVLLDQRAVLLRIFLALGLLNRRAIARRKSGELPVAGRPTPRSIRAARAAPISVPARALLGRLALPASFSLPPPLALALTLAGLTGLRHRARTQPCLRKRKSRLRLCERIRGRSGIGLSRS